jgi:hypothetical protein
MLEEKFDITKEDIEEVNKKIIDNCKLKKSHPTIYKIKEYFKRPSLIKFQIKGNNNTPNFYMDILGYKQKIIKINLTQEEINNSYKKALKFV